MLNTSLQVLSKDGTIADNTYQVIAEDGAIPQGDVVLTTAQLNELPNIQGKKALYITVNDSPETHQFPLCLPYHCSCITNLTLAKEGGVIFFNSALSCIDNLSSIC